MSMAPVAGPPVPVALFFWFAMLTLIGLEPTPNSPVMFPKACCCSDSAPNRTNP